MAALFYEKIPIVENNDPLVDLADYDFICEPAYFNQGLAALPKLYTRLAIADKLTALQRTVLTNYQFKIWDPWRSRETQYALYELCLQELQTKNPAWDAARVRQEASKFVSDPDRADRVLQHSTGGSIDLTLVARATGQALNMGTGFDHFGAEAAPGYFDDVDSVVRDNRRLLRDAMLGAGFTQDPDEWWHFDYGNQKWAEAVGKDVAFYSEISSI